MQSIIYKMYRLFDWSGEGVIAAMFTVLIFSTISFTFGVMVTKYNEKKRKR